MTAGAGTVRAALLLIALLLTACSNPAPSTAPPTEAAAGAFQLGCVGIEQGECESVARLVAAGLPEARGVPFAILVELYDCENPGPCARSLAARPGRAIAEYLDGGEPVALELAGPPGAPAVRELEVAWSGLHAASSARVAGPGPHPYEVGHCGLTWQVDFDGAYWLLVGQVQEGAFALLNGESGTIRLVDPNHAVYTSPTGFTAQLVRFPGPKRVWLCD